MNTVLLIRHGENPANLTRQFSYKHVDYALTPRGVAQAQQLAARLAAQGIDEIHSSPLKRAQETAAIVAARLDLPVTVHEGFREMNVGILEDVPPTDAVWAYHDRIVTGWLAGARTVAFPGGEDFVTLIARVRAALEDVLAGKDGRRIAVVAHGGVILAVRHGLCVDPNGLAIPGPLGNCGITEVAFTREAGALVGRLQGWNDCAHLTAAPA